MASPFTNQPTPGTAPPVRLREIDFNVSNLCNLTCAHCSYSSSPDRTQLTLDGSVIHRVMDEAAVLGNQVVHWSGGEPTMRPDLGELIRHAADLHFDMRLLSNGTLLDERRLTSLWNDGLRKIFVSLDGLQHGHDVARNQPGLFHRTVRGIRNSLAAGYDVRVNSVGTTLNVDELPNVLRFVAGIGVSTYTVFYLIPVGRGRDIVERCVSASRWRELIEQLRVTAAESPQVEVTVEKVFSWADEWGTDEVAGAGRGGGCAGFLKSCDYVNILADGSVYPCVCLIDVTPPLGNITKESLSDVLHDAQRWAQYDKLRFTPTACAECELFAVCGGGNHPASRTMRDTWDALDPRCSGRPREQGYAPMCFMLRENVTSGLRSGFAEAVGPTASQEVHP